MLWGMTPKSSISHENISRRAHQIWEETGRRDGSETVNWLQAERELESRHAKAGEVDGARGNRVEPPAAGRHAPEKARHSTDSIHPGVTTDSLHHVRNR
jgi:hypothetical protein